MTAADSHLSHLLRTGLAALALAAMATPGSATERETLLHRCWILGVTPASAIERKPT